MRNILAGLALATVLAASSSMTAQATVIFDNINGGAALLGKPSKATNFTIMSVEHIDQIKDFHIGAMDAVTINIYEKSKLIGSWSTVATVVGHGGRGDWIYYAANPDITLGAGTYTIKETEALPSWAYNGNSKNQGFSQVSASAVPEPSTWALLLLGFGGLGFAGYRRNKGIALAA